MVDYIIKSVAEFYKIDVNDLVNGGRERISSEPRHVAAYCIRSFTTLSLPKIAELLGRRNHGTIMYAIRKVDDWRKNPKLNTKAADCIKHIITSIVEDGNERTEKA